MENPPRFSKRPADFFYLPTAFGKNPPPPCGRMGLDKQGRGDGRMKWFPKQQRQLNRVVLLETAAIRPSPYQPRRRFDPKALEELAQSIRENGLLQPVTVRETEDGYELVAGERRLLACRSLGMAQIPAIIQPYGEQQAAILALTENLQRQDLNYFEEAQGIQQLMALCGLTQQQAAEKLGKAQSTIANKLRLLSFSQPLRQKMLDCGLTERHARALLPLGEEQEIRRAVDWIVANKRNVGETEAYVQQLLAARQPPKGKATRLFVVKDLRIFQNSLQKAVDAMKLAGIQVDTQRSEDDQYIHYTLRIPKKSAYRSSHTA